MIHIHRHLLALSVYLPLSSSSSSSLLQFSSPLSRSNDLISLRQQDQRRLQQQQRRQESYCSAYSATAAFVTSLGGRGVNGVNLIGKEGHIFGSFHSPHPPSCYHRLDQIFFVKTNDASSIDTTTTSDLKYIGGEYAGVYSTHSSLTGKLIPVPDHYVPAAMKEWDMVPAYFEFLLSDELLPEEQQKEKEVSNIISFKRRTATILPEVGCGIDNLDVMSNVDTTILGQPDQKEGNGMVHIFGDEEKIMTFDKNSPSLSRKDKDLPRKRIETIFYLPIPNDEDNQDGGKDEEGKTQQRFRVAFDILPTEGAIHDKIILSLEHPFPDGLFGVNKKKNVAGLVDGGGLDGRTVSTLIGRDILNYAKSLHNEDEEEMEGKITVEDLVGTWKRLGETQEEGKLNTTAEDWKAVTTFFLPGNVLIRSGVARDDDNCWQVEVSHVDTSRKEEKARRIVVRRTYDMEQGNMISEDGTPEYFVEEKV